ncbi:MAG: hypothetical protein LBR23_05540 [Spirochaetaceae bacterium]|nr:hypothetical protein [Spirochaetaceae bacterium]
MSKRKKTKRNKKKLKVREIIELAAEIIAILSGIAGLQQCFINLLGG